MERIKRILCKFVVCWLLLCCLVSASLAWFTDGREIETEITGSSISNYFAGGTGEETDPFILKSPRHVYNLAWLQDIGQFNKGDTVYFRVDADIDMAGSIRNGAIPPIGTSDIPFVGSFDGNGHTISNLWVSSDPDDWEENPEGYDNYEVGTDIGFFGSIADKAFVTDVFLKNVEVTNNVANASVGLVAGHVGASLQQIGVKNGSFSFSGGSANSEISLIGRLGDGVKWTDKPHDAVQPSNGLLINPSGDGIASVGDGKAPKGATLIEGADTTTTADDKYSAYYCGSISASTPSPPPKGTYIYKGGNIDFDGAKKTYQVQSGQTELLTADTQNVDPSFKDLMMNKTNPDGTTVGNYNIITITGAPTFTGNMPNNAIWFKPQTTGTCVIAFMKTNNSADNVYGAIYRYKRAANGSIDRSTLQEVVLNMPKNNGGVPNGCLAYFQFTISDLDYEYAIANSSNTGNKVGNAEFVFLRLAGAGESDEDVPENTPIMKNIDYMEAIPELAGATTESKNQFWADYEVHKTYLQFAGASAGNLYYNALSDGLVHYCSVGSATISDLLTNPESRSTTYSEQTFPPRETGT